MRTDFCRAYGFYFFVFIAWYRIMTRLYCHTVCIALKKNKKRIHEYNSGERDTFALTYCRDDECNRWHRLKKQVIDYHSFFSLNPSVTRPFVRRDDYFRVRVLAFQQGGP